MAMSEFGANVIEGPVGNSPGPEMMLSVTGGELLNGLPLASTTVTMSCASSVPSTDWRVDLSAVRRNSAGTPPMGHSGGGIFRYSFRYQYHARLGSRK
jgi:hypothetical protein